MNALGNLSGTTNHAGTVPPGELVTRQGVPAGGDERQEVVGLLRHLVDAPPLAHSQSVSSRCAGQSSDRISFLEAYAKSMESAIHPPRTLAAGGRRPVASRNTWETKGGQQWPPQAPLRVGTQRSRAG